MNEEKCFDLLLLTDESEITSIGKTYIGQTSNLKESFKCIQIIIINKIKIRRNTIKILSK